MSYLAGRRIVLGVTGGIAAYKAIEVCRRLVDAGAHVSPVMTTGAQRFVGTTTFSALASEPVRASLWDDADPIPHTAIGQSADLVLVAPATARVLGAYAAGISERPAHGHAAGHPGAGRRVPGDAHRDVGAPGGAGEPGHAAAARRARRGAGGRPAGRRRHRRRSPGRPGDHRRHRRAHPRAGRPARPARGGHRRWHAEADRRGAGHHQPLVGQAGLRRRHGGRRPRRAWVSLVTTVDRPAPAGVEAMAVESAADVEMAVTELMASADVLVMAAAVADFRPKVVADGKLQEGRRAARGRARTHHRHPGRPRRPQASRPDAGRLRGRDRRPGRERAAASCGASTSISSWPTTCRRPVPVSSTTPTKSSSSAPTGTAPEIPLTDKRPCRAVLDAVVAIRDGRPFHPPRPHPRPGARVSRRWTFTSESVTEGHPDKMADQITDAVLDAIIERGPLLPGRLRDAADHRPVVVAGEITTIAYVDIPRSSATPSAASATTASPTGSTATPAA